MYYNVVAGFSSSDVTSGALQGPKASIVLVCYLFTGCSSGSNSGLGWASGLM